MTQRCEVEPAGSCRAAGVQRFRVALPLSDRWHETWFCDDHAGTEPDELRALGFSVERWRRDSQAGQGGS